MTLVRCYAWWGREKRYVIGGHDMRDPKTGQRIPTAGRWSPHKSSATPFTMAEARDLTRRLKKWRIKLKLEEIADQAAAGRQIIMALIERNAA